MLQARRHKALVQLRYYSSLSEKLDTHRDTLGRIGQELGVQQVPNYLFLKHQQRIVKITALI